MHRLRRTPLIARLVLAWFALFLGAATASPWLQPAAWQMVCSGGAIMKMVLVDDTGAADAPAASGMTCPLCLPAGGAPPADIARLPDPPPAHAQPVSAVLTAPHGWLSRAALPPRGPPVAA